MAGKDERIFFMEDYAGNLAAVPESRVDAFQKGQKELRRKIDAGEMEDPLESHEFDSILRIFKRD